MFICNKWKGLILTLLTAAGPVSAKNKIPLPDTALDGGVVSAESLGRGRTTASNRATPAAGSENPASLIESTVNASYATVLVDTRSNMDPAAAEQTDPLTGKVLQYFSMQGEKGVLFYEPISRIHENQILDPLNPTTDYREVEYSANAIGFAGAERLGQGSMGISMAYLWSAVGVVEHRTGVENQETFDTADGLRLNFGVRYPTGPAMWGLLVENAPGLLWGKDFQRTTLPFKVRVGNTVRLQPGLLLSVDWEHARYSEGSNKENSVYIGTEAFMGKHFILRAGLFGPDVTDSKQRRATGGLTVIARTGAQLSYAMEIFKQDNEDVKRSLVSFQAPFETSDLGSAH